MKKEKKIIALLLALCMVFAMAGCGGDGAESDADIMKEAIEKMNSVESMSAEMVMEMVMSAEDQTVEMTTTMTEEVINDPMMLKMDMDMTLNLAGQTQQVKNIVYGEVVDDNLVTYIGMNGQWSKVTQSGMEALKDYDNTESLKVYLEAIENFKKTGTETVSGVEADKYEGVITEKYFSDMLEQSGLDTQMGLEGVDAETLSELFKGIEDLPITIWIGKEDKMPVKYDLDMTDMMGAVIKNIGDEAAAEVGIDKVTVSMVITGYNNIDSIEIPEEARNAQEATA